ncbi:MAG: nickel-dependent hydrogenase large subunit [Sulfurospirillaceae bacterium]|nr:nickel-dependent hydrogenase large subunit [Sulfurospirillaceae bacterium]
MSKKIINIPIGSQHISLLEPVRFNFTTENEKIVGIDWDVGFVHRGIEKACTQKFEYKQVGYVVARVCGLCAITHSLAYTYAIEKLLGIELTKKIQYLRVMMLELDRIHSHMLCLSHTVENAGFEAMFMKIMGDRELVMEMQEAISGNRIQFDYISIGGVNRDLDQKVEKQLLINIKLLDEKIDDLIEKFQNNWSLSLKFKGIGVLSKEDAYYYNAMGPLARAAGARIDTRLESSFMPHAEVGYETVLFKDGDIHARNMVRLLEIKNSIQMIRNIVQGLPEGEIQVKAKGKPTGEALVRLEAPRGEIFYYVRGVGENMLSRVRIKTPTYSQVPTFIRIFKGANYADAHAILASLDPCMSCTAK